jgi:hypothetical protein
VLFKNMVMASMAVLAWWLLGHAFGFGKDVSGFVGNTNYGGREIYNNHGARPTTFGIGLTTGRDTRPGATPPGRVRLVRAEGRGVST